MKHKFFSIVAVHVKANIHQTLLDVLWVVYINALYIFDRLQCTSSSWCKFLVLLWKVPTCLSGYFSNKFYPWWSDFIVYIVQNIKLQKQFLRIYWFQLFFTFSCHKISVSAYVHAAFMSMLHRMQWCLTNILCFSDWLILTVSICFKSDV